MSSSAENDDRPPFDNPFTGGGSAEERVYDAILQTRAPTGAKAIADRASCDPKTARKYLEWFATLGIVTKHEGEPLTYERNDAYFEWRRVNELAASRSPERLEARVAELSDRLQRYRTRYTADLPGDVDALSPPDGISTEEAFSDLTDWETARVELRRYERARRIQSSDSGSIEV